MTGGEKEALREERGESRREVEIVTKGHGRKAGPGH